MAVRLFVHYLNRTPEVRDMLEGWNKTLQFDLKGESPFHVDVRGERAKLAVGTADDPDLVFSAPAELFLGIITNQVDADEAFMNGKYVVEGPPGDAARFRLISERVQEHHPRTFGVLQRMAPLALRGARRAA